MKSSFLSDNTCPRLEHVWERLGQRRGRFDDAERRFKKRHPIGNSPIHLILQDVGEHDKVAVLQRALHFGELPAEFFEEYIPGEVADGEGGGADIVEFREVAVTLLDLLPAGKDTAETVESGSRVPFFQEGSDFLMLGTNPFNERGEFAQHRER